MNINNPQPYVLHQSAQPYVLHQSAQPYVHQSTQPYDFLHRSRKRYTFFCSKASKAGMLHWTWWLLTLVHHSRLYRALNRQNYRPNAISAYMPSWNYTIIVMHTWTYRRNEKVHFLLHLNIRKNKLIACLLHHIDIVVVSEWLCHLRTQCLVQSPNICNSLLESTYA